MALWGLIHGALANRHLDKAVRLFPVLRRAPLCALCVYPVDAGREIEKAFIDSRWTKLAQQAMPLQPSQEAHG